MESAIVVSFLLCIIYAVFLSHTTKSMNAIDLAFFGFTVTLYAVSLGFLISLLVSKDDFS